MITTRVIDDAAEFNALQRDWNNLLQASSCGCLFLTWEWLHTWWTYLAENRKLHIIAVWNGGKLIGIAPLALRPAFSRKWMPLPALEFLGAGSVGSDYLSFLLRNGHEQDALRQIAESLASTRLMVELVRVEKTSLTMINLAHQLRQSNWKSFYLTTNYCPYITLADHSWDTFLNSLHSTHRKQFERKFKRLYRKFEVKFDRVQSESQRQSAMATYLDLHLKRWSGGGGSSAIGDEKHIHFHQHFSSISLNRGWLRMYTLSLSGKPAAVLYMFRFKDVYYYYQCAFETSYGNLSVGMVSLSLAIKDAIEDGAAEFDFLHDDEEYKYLWAHEERPLIRLELYPSMHVGRIYQKLQSTRHRLAHRQQPAQSI
jgi:CelD/BcsL family acetyltransferase involved in cellulose biosynthesis